MRSYLDLTDDKVAEEGLVANSRCWASEDISSCCCGSVAFCLGSSLKSQHLRDYETFKRAGEGTSIMSGTSRGMFVAMTLRWICSNSTTIMGHSVRVLKLAVLFARVLGALSPPSNSSVTEPGFGENAGYTISTKGKQREGIQWQQGWIRSRLNLSQRHL